MREFPSIARKADGFTLAELAISLLVIGLLLFLLLPTSAVMLSNSHRSTTLQKLNNIDAAMINYVIVNKRLPCPADGALAQTAAGAGVEGARDANFDCTNLQVRGVVPWVTIGMTAPDVLDGWNHQITYRVGFGLTRNNALDMSSCDPAGTQSATSLSGSINVASCAATCTGTFVAGNCSSPQSFLANRGLDVQTTTLAASKVMQYNAATPTGAAYVLISHGDNGFGSYSASGVYQTPGAGWPSPKDGTTLEDPNWNSGNTITNAAPPSFVDTAFSDSSTITAYFDDIMVRPLIFSVISRAQLGPRSH